MNLQTNRKPTQKKATNVGTRKSTKVKREKKADDDKADIMALVINALEGVDNLVIVNAEREIAFEFNNRKFKIVLSAPRS